MSQNIKEENSNVEQRFSIRSSFKQNPKFSICFGAAILAAVIIGFSIMALMLRKQENPSLTVGKYLEILRKPQNLTKSPSKF